MMRINLFEFRCCRKMMVSAFATTLFFFSLVSNAQEINGIIKEKTKELIELLSETKAPSAGVQISSLPFLVNALNSTLASGNVGQLSETLSQVLLQRAHVGEKAVLLAAEINTLIQEESKKVSAAEIASLEELFRLVGKSVIEAKVPADLDEIIYKVIDAESERRSISRQEEPRLSALRQQVSSAKSFLESWQDSLAHSESGNFQQAHSSMRNALGQNSNFTPRSELLARVTSLDELSRKQSGQPVEAENVDVITIEEIAEALGSIEEAMPLMDRWISQNQQSNRRSDPAVQRFFSRFGEFVTTYERYHAGLPFDLSFATTLSTSSSTEIPRGIMTRLNALELSFAKQVLPRYLGLENAPEPADEESLDQYFHRLLRHYSEAGKTMEARRLVSVQGILRLSRTVVADELLGLRHYAAAQSQIEAGQHRLAVQSLHSALRSGSPLVPAREVGALLRQLEQDFPEEYQLGTHQPLPVEFSISYTRSGTSDLSRSNSVTNIVLPIPGVSTESKRETETKAPADTAEPASPSKQ